MTILFFSIDYVPFFLLSSPSEQRRQQAKGVAASACSEKTWGYLVVVIVVESSAHSPTPSVPHCPDTAQVCCSWESGPGPPTAPLMLPHKPLLSLDARPQHVLPLDHIWMFLDKLQVVRQ